MPLAGPPSPPPAAGTGKPIILHLGDPIVHDLEFYSRLQSQFEFINPPLSDLHRATFIKHLRERTWGDFSAIMRPFWNTGGEMGRWDGEIIDLLPESVKVYASAGAGYDWVDTHALAKHGILYCNARGASTEAVADTALWHIISVFRNMTISHLSARSLNPKSFNEAHFDLPLISRNPRNHNLGIIGLGDIGFAIAKKVYIAFGMKILYNDIERKPLSQELEVNAQFYPNLEEMLGQSDCVVIATPFSGQTLITASLLEKFKPGSRLVNIARGSLIDETALADALDRGHLSAAGLDVHAHEPHVNERLAKNRRVELTSHTGGGALETWIKFEKLAMENVERVLTGREALTGVNGQLIKRDENDAELVNGHSNHDEAPNSGKTGPSSAAHVNGDHQPGSNHPEPYGARQHSNGVNGDTGVSIAQQMDGSMHRQAGIMSGV
ncbi:MAG: hypothetical protein Q9195_004900 [Heterodermia aff. obscurata]